jgi:catechol 2,3-dioxygenase-like lactoylglutathione lyase family enzyme
MPLRMIRLIDLAVSDVERSRAFYPAVLGPFGLDEEVRYPSYRGTEEVVYLRFSATGARSVRTWTTLGIKPAL